MKTTNIKGKDYVMVNERIKYFREKFPDYKLITEIIELNAEQVVMVAKVINDAGVIVANGHAFEDKQSSMINKTSYIENCETSAWGRALANFGIGIDSSVASADEVSSAIRLQESIEKLGTQPTNNTPPPKPSKSTDDDKAKAWKEFSSKCKEHGVDPIEFLKKDGIDMNDKAKVYSVVRQYLKLDDGFLDDTLSDYAQSA